MSWSLEGPQAEQRIVRVVVRDRPWWVLPMEGPLTVDAMNRARTAAALLAPLDAGAFTFRLHPAAVVDVHAALARRTHYAYPDQVSVAFRDVPVELAFDGVWCDLVVECEQ